MKPGRPAGPMNMTARTIFPTPRSTTEMPDLRLDGRGVVAVLGPTNTGKTHLAIERMVAHESGLIGLPLRLLAREVYDRVAEKVGAANAALVTGEEKINAEGGARFQVCTVEAMPEETDAAFVAIDEVQLAADLERGHVFTDRLLNLRGRHETMLLGAETVAYTLRQLLPGIEIVSRPRMSVLTYSGQKKITRLPRRSAIVAFSAEEVYTIAELIRRQRGGAAVVMGSLSPRTRNAQVALYQSGDVDFLVATDAIGMGLNLDLDHVAFAQDAKFDGLTHRRLFPAELGQIAGRAGRHINNGTFGVTGRVRPFDDELVERLETHRFDTVQVLVWRNRALEFGSLEALRASLDAPSSHPHLMKSVPASDATALANLERDEAVRAACSSEATIRLLWEVCKIPDYRRISPGEHAELLRSIFGDLARDGRIDEDWFAAQVRHTDRTTGDIDALSARIAHIRTWTYLSNRSDWLSDPEHWRERTREIEDRLSDALHESLTKRFIDRRTSVLMKRLRENAMLEAEIAADGEVTVEGHHVGRLIGFRFTPDNTASGAEAKAANGAAMKALAAEFTKKAERLYASSNADFALGSDATLRWLGEPVAKAAAGADPLHPRIILLADEQLTGQPREMVAHRLERWLSNHVVTLLKPLADILADESLAGTARGVGYRLVEELGAVPRHEIATDIQALDQQMRASLRRHGVRFGAHHIFVPVLLKPAPMALIAQLWAIHHGRLDAAGLEEIPAIAAAGRTSFPADPDFDTDVYRVCGFRLLGGKAVRIDILERLADLIRPALAWKPRAAGQPPEGAVDGRSFVATPAMLSILGATHETMNEVLKTLGYRGEPKTPEEVAEIRSKHGALPELPAGQDDAAEKTDASTKTDTETGDKPETTETATDGCVATQQAGNAPATADAPAGSAADTSGQAPIGPDGSGKAPDTEAAEERLVMLWRPARGDRGRRQGGRGSSARKSAPSEGRSAGKSKGKGGNGRGRGSSGTPHKGAQKPGRGRADTPVDPDSPFAKLAKLKADLEKGDG